MELDTKLQKAFDKLDTAEKSNDAVWVEPVKNQDDAFQDDIKDTAKTLLTAIKRSAGGAYALEATELARLTKAVCDLQVSFFGKDDKASGNIIMTNQLSMFKDML